jgi:hypothetical protein
MLAHPSSRFTTANRYWKTCTACSSRDYSEPMVSRFSSPSSGDITSPAQIDTRSFRDVLYSSILATDMSLHFAWIDELKAFVREFREGLERRDDEEARVLLCQAMIKCADISNPVSVLLA